MKRVALQGQGSHRVENVHLFYYSISKWSFLIFIKKKIIFGYLLKNRPPRGIHIFCIRNTGFPGQAKFLDLINIMKNEPIK